MIKFFLVSINSRIVVVEILEVLVLCPFCKFLFRNLIGDDQSKIPWLTLVTPNHDHFKERFTKLIRKSSIGICHWVFRSASRKIPVLNALPRQDGPTTIRRLNINERFSSLCRSCCCISWRSSANTSSQAAVMARQPNYYKTSFVLQLFVSLE